jgi:hypothetical protein
MPAQDWLTLRSSESTLSWLAEGGLDEGTPSIGVYAAGCDKKSLVSPPEERLTKLSSLG